MSIQAFPLAWRWTDPKYVLLPSEALQQMTALDTAAAASVHDRWFPCFDGYGEVIPHRFARIERRQTEGTWERDACRRQQPLIEEVRDWLRQREADLALPVTVSWTREWAIRTTWAIFTRWWDDFCYAGSDDVLVVPDTARWLLAFHHEDWFSFCYEPVG